MIQGIVNTMKITTKLPRKRGLTSVNVVIRRFHYNPIVSEMAIFYHSSPSAIRPGRTINVYRQKARQNSGTTWMIIA